MGGGIEKMGLFVVHKNKTYQTAGVILGALSKTQIDLKKM